MPNVTATFPAFFLNQGKDRQAIINGNMQIWQRGTSFTPSEDETYTADRWIIEHIADADSLDVERYECTDAEQAKTGCKTALEITQVSTGSFDYQNRLKTKIPDVAFGAGDVVSLGFWAWRDGISYLNGIQITQHFGTGGSPSAPVVTTLTTADIYLASTPIFFDFTTALPSISGKVLGTNGDDYVEVAIQPRRGRVAGIRITGVQMNIGTQCLPIIHEAPDKVLADCQRFYERIYAHTGLFPISGLSADDTQITAVLTYTAKCRGGVVIRCPEATNFSIVGYNALSNVTGFSQVVRPDNRNTSNIIFTTTPGNLTPERIYMFHCGLGLHYIEIDAEL